MVQVEKEHDATKEELASTKEIYEEKLQSMTVALTEENSTLKESLKSATKRLTVSEESLAVVTKDLSKQTNLANMLKKTSAEMKATCDEEKAELQVALEEAQASVQSTQEKVDNLELEVTTILNNEAALQRALESALQSATEMRDAPEDVLAQARHGAWIGLYRNVGKILDSKFPLGAQ